MFKSLCTYFLQLFFPIVKSGHWFAFVVDFEEKVFAFLDSYYDKNSPFHLAIRDRLVSVFFGYFLLFLILICLSLKSFPSFFLVCNNYVSILSLFSDRQLCSFVGGDHQPESQLC